MKKFIIIPTLLLAAVVALSGCFGGLGGYGAQPTNPPEKVYKSIDEFTQAVADAKANLDAADEADLKGLTGYYMPKMLPDGTKVSYIKVSTLAVRIGYTFGSTSTENYDKQLELVYYRNVKTSDFLSQTAQSMTNYDSISSGGNDYLHAIPDIQLIVTPSPGDTAVATPTPRTEKYFQLVYWVQGDACFMCAMPLGFTKDDIGKYCQAERVELK